MASHDDVMIDCYASTDRGRRRSQNEDAFICDEDVAIFLVADGMGGENYGEVASRLTADNFVQLIIPFITDEDATIPFDTPEDGDHFTAVMLHAVEGTNRAVYEYAVEHESHKGMGSTLTAVVLRDGFLYVAHVGDSRLYRIQSDDILQITEDHTKVQEMVQKDILTPEEARKHPQKNIITRCVGRNRRLKPDVFTTDFTNGDIFLICSDGLNDMIEDDEIHRIVAESDSLETAACGLVELANENGGKDNITVVLFRLDSVTQ